MVNNKLLKNEVDTSLVSEDTYSYLSGTFTVLEQGWYCRVHILRGNVSQWRVIDLEGYIVTRFHIIGTE